MPGFPPDIRPCCGREAVSGDKTIDPGKPGSETGCVLGAQGDRVDGAGPGQEKARRISGSPERLKRPFEEPMASGGIAHEQAHPVPVGQPGFSGDDFPGQALDPFQQCLDPALRHQRRGLAQDQPDKTVCIPGKGKK